MRNTDMHRRAFRQVVVAAAVAAVCVLGVSFAGMWTWGTVQVVRALPEGASVANDGSVFWAAARLAVAGDWLAPFDAERLAAARALAPDQTQPIMLWLYPPSYLALTAPFGALGFYAAWAITAGLSLAALIGAFAVFRSLGAWQSGAIVLAPAIVVCLAQGQNSVFFAAALVVFIETWRRERVWLAALALVVLSLKPQLGVAIAVVLLATGAWGVIGRAVLCVAVMVVATLIYPGGAYWSAWLQAVQHAGDVTLASGLGRLLISPLGLGLAFGWDRTAALALQALVSGLVLVVLARTWRQAAVSPDAKAAALSLAILLVTPYVVYYELVFALVAAVYLIGVPGAVGKSQDQGQGQGFALVLWVLPVAAHFLGGVIGYGVVAPILLVVFLMVCRRGNAVAGASS
ncbi:MAG: glycosyltransferase family 87 protein [Pseudomonadota bacterium]